MPSIYLHFYYETAIYCYIISTKFFLLADQSYDYVNFYQQRQFLMENGIIKDDFNLQVLSFC